MCSRVWLVTSREHQNKMFKFDVMSLEVGYFFFIIFVIWGGGERDLRCLHTCETAVSRSLRLVAVCCVL